MGKGNDLHFGGLHKAMRLLQGNKSLEYHVSLDEILKKNLIVLELETGRVVACPILPAQIVEHKH